MCRLLGVVSRTHAPLPELLGESLGGFTELACEHSDGWGIAYLQEDRLVTARETQPAGGSELFDRVVAGAVTDSALLHIRLANNGYRLMLENTHPFTTDTLAFAHNGDFLPRDAVNSSIDPDLLAQARGTTDSEQFFLLVRSKLRYTDPVTALLESAAEIRENATSVSSLNCLLLTDDALYGYTYHDPDSEVSSRRGPGFFSLSYRVEPDRVIVASSGWPQPAPQWSPLRDTEVVEIRRGDLTLTRHTRIGTGSYT